ncbi:MAG: hypothetical protein HUJ73_08645 [Eubacterium sp.]|nr:hypothetical protein [Eubacterium sp.]
MKSIIKTILPAAVLGVVFFVCMGVMSHADKIDKTVLEEGRNWAEAQDSENTELVEKTIKEQAAIKKTASLTAEKEALQKGEVDVWSLFQDFAILGDSRAVGFWYFDFLPETRVFAEGGYKISNIPEFYENIRILNPSGVFLCFGLNDVMSEYWETPEDYVAEFREILADMQENFPDMTIYVNSIFPALDPAFDLSTKLYEIPDYSKAVGEMCAELDIPFVNNDTVFEQHKDLVDIDGIHFTPPMYPYWAENMMLTVYDHLAKEKLNEELSRDDAGQ